MPLYIGDYLADTSHLSMEQSGAYLHLLMHQWRRGTVPDQDAQLAAICRYTVTRWQRKIAPAIRPLFTPMDGALVQLRLHAEREKSQKTSDERTLAANKRWNRSKGDVINENNDVADAKASGCISRAYPSHNHIKKESSGDKPPEQAAPSPAVIPPVPDLVEGVHAPTAREIMWRSGPAIIRQLTGCSAGASRGMLGKMLREMQEDCIGVVQILTEGQSLHPLADPNAWLMAAARGRRGRRRVSQDRLDGRCCGRPGWPANPPGLRF